VRIRATAQRIGARAQRIWEHDRLPIHLIDVFWSAFTLLMLSWMMLDPERQTIPYHLIFVSFTLLYGYRLWSPRVTSCLLIALTVIPGLMFIKVYHSGAVSMDELAEVPLMPLIVGGMAWHAQRSASARRRLEVLAKLESSRLERQQEFLRDTAHAIRTPVTIARGHIELIQMATSDPQFLEDTDEVLHQLDRMHGMARRLLVIEALRTAELIIREPVDVGALVNDIGRRWARSGITRRFVVQAPDVGVVLIDKLRLEEALDAMIENAVRFAGPEGSVQVSCRAQGGWVQMEVADSGPGISIENRNRVFDRFFQRHPVGQEPGTGLGLALVAAVAAAFEGSAWAGEAAAGGALITQRLPWIASSISPIASIAISPSAIRSSIGASGAEDSELPGGGAVGSATTQS
jgi:signal transduction histidine kinase